MNSLVGGPSGILDRGRSLQPSQSNSFSRISFPMFLLDHSSILLEPRATDVTATQVMAKVSANHSSLKHSSKENAVA